MAYDPDIHHRRSIRWKKYDYSQEGFYFVTICVTAKDCLFGKIVDHKVFLNPSGEMIENQFFKLETKYSNIRCDEFVCMPNHIHFILNFKPHLEPDPSVQLHSLGELIQWFKTMTTNEYIRQVKENSWKPFQGRLWQRNYWERVIRSEQELYFVREYIKNNPEKWESDRLFSVQ